MNYKVQLSPISTPQKAHSPLGIDIKRSAIAWEDARFFRSWLFYDSGLEHSRAKATLNWNVLAGFVIMAAISASGWYGFALLLEHFLK
jgi:hypothetical protein